MNQSRTQGAVPLRHLSIRSPWHDSGWNGRVCQRPSENAACLVLQRIRESRKDDTQEKVAGKPWFDLPTADLPPCVSERAGTLLITRDDERGGIDVQSWEALLDKVYGI